MDYRMLDKSRQGAVAGLFTAVFSASEGEQEGRLVGKLAAELATQTGGDEVLGFGAFEGQALIAAIFFTRLRFDAPLSVYLLGPVAVGTGHQGQGVGQGLIRYGLEALKARSVAVAITYGDPAYYRRVGFQALSETTLRAPLPLSMPQGWLGQSLTEAPIPTLSQRPTCVPALNDPVYW